MEIAYLNMLPLKKIKGTVFYRGGIAAIDHGFISLINFGVQILLIKSVTQAEFGFYSLAFSIIMYSMSFQNAVVNTPITVSLAGKTLGEKSIYVSSVFNGQLYSLFIICSLGALVSYTAHYFGLFNDYGILAASIFIGSFGILNREFLRSYFFAEEQPLRALKLDLFYGLLYIFLISITFLFFNLSVPLVLIFMGLAASFDSLILNKNFKYKFNFNDIKKAYLENWQISKWSLIGITVTHLQKFSYLYIIGSLLGSAAMAEVSASKLLLMPLGLFVNGWGNVVRPYGSKLRVQGRLKQFFRNLVIMSLAFLAIVFAITFALYILKGTILKYFFTVNYESIFDYLFFWAALTSIGFLQANASYGLQVIKKFKSLAFINAGTMIITVTMSFILTSNYQIKGALTASLIGTIAFASILWYLLYKSIFKKKV
jgi:O-antigen/teichoic acid export membrane protein